MITRNTQTGRFESVKQKEGETMNNTNYGFYSKVLNKPFDTVEKLKQAEAAYNEQVKKEQEQKLAVEQTKKKLAKACEAAEDAVSAAYEELKKAKEKAAEILNKSNAEVEAILKQAKDKVHEAEQARSVAIKNFNNAYGPYTVSYTGEKAQKELDRFFDLFDDIFDSWF